MTPWPTGEFKELQKRLQTIICNQMTYPKVLVSLAKNRCLTEQEIRKASEIFDMCSKIVDAEMTLFALKMERN